MSDHRNDSHLFRTFNVLTNYNRGGLGIKVEFSLPSQQVIHSLKHIIDVARKATGHSRSNGPEYISQQLDEQSKNYPIVYPAWKADKIPMRNGLTIVVVN